MPYHDFLAALTVVGDLSGVDLEFEKGVLDVRQDMNVRLSSGSPFPPAVVMASAGCGDDEHLAWPGEPIWTLESGQLLANLGPGFLPVGLG